MSEPRYLLAKAERLTYQVLIPGGGGDKVHPYEWKAQRERLAPRAARVAQTLADLPATACPEDRSVAVITINPSYFAKSYFPSELLRDAQLRAIGSRPVYVKPDKGKNGASTAIFVAGKRRAFAAFADMIPRSGSDVTDLLTIEDIHVPAPEDRFRLSSDSERQTLEVVLHAPASWESVVEGFDEYLTSMGLRADVLRRHYVRDLCFMPVSASLQQLHELGLFSFLRVARTMPRLREMRPAATLTRSNADSYALPDAPSMDAGIRVAIFDGGLAPTSPLRRWVQAQDAPAIGAPTQDFLDHGTDVTSAALFGSLDGQASPPYFDVEHYRVLDEHSYDPNGEYYDVLDRIVEILGTKHFDFVNLSVGPRMPIEDDEVHPWTAKLDEMLSEGKTLLVSAVGNDGALDRQAGLARIQPPSDGVNLLSIGAAGTPGKGWAPAPYSCIGPGRSPGFMKPDIVSFGGSPHRPFLVCGKSSTGVAKPTCGTSFAAPNVLRTAGALRAHFGSTITPLAIRSLLVHHAEPGAHLPREVGWGAIPDDIHDLVECPPGTAYILYQGVLEPRQSLRADIPMPTGVIPGLVSIRATFCIATDIDPQDSSNYTRSGLIPTFRPNRNKSTPKFDKRTQQWRTPVHPDSAGFFKLSEMATEHELRVDALKWETVLRREKRFRGTSLVDPMFDVHFNPREGGADAKNPKPIPYALIITVQARAIPDLYDRIANRYRTQLEALKPVIAIPVRTRIVPTA